MKILEGEAAEGLEKIKPTSPRTTLYSNDSLVGYHTILYKSYATNSVGRPYYIQRSIRLVRFSPPGKALRYPDVTAAARSGYSKSSSSLTR